jgi:hypothetical protein
LEGAVDGAEEGLRVDLQSAYLTEPRLV